MRKISFAGLLLASCIAAPLTSAQTQVVATDKAPAIIFIMRHAEKPAAEENSSDLTPQGFKRAQALPSLFVATATQAARFPRPDAIFATAMSKHSNRPVETVTPLAQALHLTIQHEFEDHDTAGVAQDVLSGRYAGKVVVICWHHGEIPHLAEALGVTGEPAKWDDAVFNQIWKVTYVNGKAQYTVVPENLMPGDVRADSQR